MPRIGIGGIVRFRDRMLPGPILKEGLPKGDCIMVAVDVHERSLVVEDAVGRAFVCCWSGTEWP